MNQHSDIVIREATAADVAAISAVGHESFRSAYENTCEPDDLILHLDEFFSEAAIHGEMRKPGHCYLLASNSAHPAGFVKIRESARPIEIPATRALELNQVYVLPDQQRYGIGGKLIKAATQFAAGKSADGVWLTVWKHAPWAVNCYRKYGFEELGTTEFRLGRTVYTDLLMWRPVDSAN